MVRDFGPGLTADELVGMTAWQIGRLELPRGSAFEIAQRGAQALVGKGGESYVLEELWADGHVAWRNPQTQQTAVVTPNGHIIQGGE